MKRVYLDYNIWDEMSKDKKTLSFFKSLKDVSYYISEAHNEELFHARNMEDDNHRGCSDALRELMLSMAVKGLITYGNSIYFNKSIRGYFESIHKIEIEHDTQDIIADISKKEFNDRDEETKKGYKGMEGVNPDALYIKIWEDPVLKEKIKIKNEKGRELSVFLLNNEISTKDAIEMMGEEWKKEYDNSDGAGDLAIKYIYAQSQQICQGCYETVKGDCITLEIIIEILNKFLIEIGFKQDKTLRTYKSGKYDLQHFILSTYCDVFISKDKHFCERAKAIAYYLGIPIEVKLWKSGQLT